jgi:hypothetical protein
LIKRGPNSPDIQDSANIQLYDHIQFSETDNIQDSANIQDLGDIQSRKRPIFNIEYGARKRDRDLRRYERQLLDHRSGHQTTSLVSMLGNLDYQRLYGGYLALHHRQVPQRLLSELSNEQIASLDSVMRDYEKKLRSK